MALISSQKEIEAWYHKLRSPRLSSSKLSELYHTFHPKMAFLKMLPRSAVVADIGAGDGSLSSIRRWPAPARSDLQLHAYALEKGQAFDEYVSYEIGDWNEAPPEFGGLSFDAVVCVHFIEHIDDPVTFCNWLGRKLVPGGRAYIEWPSSRSIDLPSKHLLKDAGVELTISRFDDDKTHQRLPNMDGIIESMKAAGLSIEAQGIIRLPWLEDEMMANAEGVDASFNRQVAFWSATGWSQYLVVHRPIVDNNQPRFT